MSDIAEIFYDSFSPETKRLWLQYKKEKDPYKSILILDKIVKINMQSTMAEYDKMIKQREQRGIK